MFSSPEWSTGAPFVFSCFVVFLIQVMSLQVVASKSRREVYRLTRRSGVFLVTSPEFPGWIFSVDNVQFIDILFMNNLRPKAVMGLVETT